MTEELAPVGLVLGSELPPEELAGAAARAEELGFGELWLAEDYFFTGAIAGAGTVLAATSRVPVGLGVVSAVTRHPALLAMEIATLERAHPGRLRPAVGLGVPAWLDQMGMRPPSPLDAVRGCVSSLRALLAGEELDGEVGGFEYHGVKLTYPLDPPPPLATGVVGPKMLELSGEVADGTVLSILVGDRYIEWARERIADGASRAGRDPAAHRVSAFAVYSVDEDAQRARDAVRATVAFYLAAGGANAITRLAGIDDALVEMVGRGGPDVVAREMPDDWLRELTVTGSPDDCVAGIERLLAAGADSVALFPVPSSSFARQVQMTADLVLPSLRSG